MERSTTGSQLKKLRHLKENGSITDQVYHQALRHLEEPDCVAIADELEILLKSFEIESAEFGTYWKLALDRRDNRAFWALALDRRANDKADSRTASTPPLSRTASSPPLSRTASPPSLTAGVTTSQGGEERGEAAGAGLHHDPKNATPAAASSGAKLGDNHDRKVEHVTKAEALFSEHFAPHLIIATIGRIEETEDPIPPEIISDPGHWCRDFLTTGRCRERHCTAGHHLMLVSPSHPLLPDTLTLLCIRREARGKFVPHIEERMKEQARRKASYIKNPEERDDRPKNATTARTSGRDELRRLSGGKRDIDTAQSTDVVNNVPGSAADTNQPAAKKRKITHPLPNQCMKEGHFDIVLGEDIDVSTGRFKILSLLGQGTFGKVVEAWDRKYKIHCAVKIVRNVPKYTRDAALERKNMKKVCEADPNDDYCFMKLMRYFMNDQEHMCIVMPKCGPCLLDFIRKEGTFDHRALAEIVYQTGVGLNFFHNKMKLMHTDLKPENILLEEEGVEKDMATGRNRPKSNKVRFCDLGGCCDEHHSRSAIVSTRQYRSPEVVLGLGWMYPTDMWSMGCIIYELFTGRLLYPTHDNLEHLHMMEKTLGPIPSAWASRCSDDTRSLFKNGRLEPLRDPKQYARVLRGVNRPKPIRDTIADPMLKDLIIGLLTYDKTRRMTAAQMACHPYVLKFFPEVQNHHQFAEVNEARSEDDLIQRYCQEEGDSCSEEEGPVV